MQQAIQLGVLPRLDVRQTSDERFGQVYVTQINWLLAVAVIGLVVGFRSSDALANAYGIAVAGDMLITSLLVAIVAHGVWKWPGFIVNVVAGLFLILDATFVLANIHKIPGGGWFPLVVGVVSLTLMLSWRRAGRGARATRRKRHAARDVYPEFEWPRLSAASSRHGCLSHGSARCGPGRACFEPQA